MNLLLKWVWHNMGQKGSNLDLILTSNWVFEQDNMCTFSSREGNMRASLKLRAHIITKVITWFNLSNKTHIHCCKITCIFLIFCIEHWTFSLLDCILCNHISRCNLAFVGPVDNPKNHVIADFSLWTEIIWCQQVFVLRHFFL